MTLKNDLFDDAGMVGEIIKDICMILINNIFDAIHMDGEIHNFDEGSI